MLKLSFLFALLITSQALANECPDIQGTFVNEARDFDVIVENRIEGIFRAYRFDGQEDENAFLIADETTRTQADPDSGITLNTKGACRNGDTVKLELWEEGHEHEPYFTILKRISDTEIELTMPHLQTGEAVTLRLTKQ